MRGAAAKALSYLFSHWGPCTLLRVKTPQKRLSRCCPASADPRPERTDGSTASPRCFITVNSRLLGSQACKQRGGGGASGGNLHMLLQVGLSADCVRADDVPNPGCSPCSSRMMQAPAVPALQHVETDAERLGETTRKHELKPDS